MPNVVHWIFYYPHPDGALDNDVAGITTGYPYTGPLHGLLGQVTGENPWFAPGISRTSRCTFYIPSNLSIEPSDTLLPRSQEWLRQHRDDGPKVLSVELVNNIFPDQPQPELVHFLVVTDEILEGLNYPGDLEGLALKQRGKSTKSLKTSLPTPSVCVSTSRGLQKLLVGHTDEVHTGRPALNYGPPVPLFNHALGRFHYDLAHLDDELSGIQDSESCINWAHMFMDSATSYFPYESNRIGAIKTFLADSLGVQLLWDQHVFGIEPGAINHPDTPFVIVEVKNEAGLEGDASMQAAVSYAHIAAKVVEKNPWKLSNYPAVLFGIMGNLLEIGVAVYTDGVYYDLLFSQRLRLGFHAAKNVLRLARVCAATRRVISDLTEFHSRLMTAPPAQCSIEHMFPSPLPIPTYADAVPSLTFTCRLSRSGEPFILAEDEEMRRSGVYLATMPKPHGASGDMAKSSVDALTDTVEVVVKFTARYNPEAHRLLASGGFAPALHACVPVCGDLFMVVMDFVQGGEIAWHAGNRSELLSFDIFKDIQDAVALLHLSDFVFGDLRAQNIMVVPGRPGSDDRHRGMLIDFDWVGTHRISRYPITLNVGVVEWALADIKPFAVMDKAHDLAMLNKFKHKCRPA